MNVNENSNIWKYIALGSIIVLAVLSVAFAYLYFSSAKVEVSNEAEIIIEKVEIAGQEESSMPLEILVDEPKESIESDGFAAEEAKWIKFSDIDPDFGYQTSIYLPPEGYNFEFAGSQWYLGYIYEPKEYWDYRASFSNDRRDKSIGITNKYDGTAPQDWYLKYMNSEHPWMSLGETSEYEYLSVKEVQIGDRTYLDTTLINTADVNAKPLRTFLYVQNEILHMFTDFDGLDNGGKLEAIIGEVLVSLESEY